MYRTYMMRYRLKESVRDSGAQVMYWYGEKEMNCVKKSAACFKRCSHPVSFMRRKDTDMDTCPFTGRMSG